MLSAILKRHISSESFLPKYKYHVTPSIVTLDDGRVMFVVRASGVPFEAVGVGKLDSEYDSLNNLFLSIGKSTGSRLAAWCFVDHFETDFTVKYNFSYQWLRDMNERYMAQFKNRLILENQFFIACVLKGSINDSLEDTIKEAGELEAMVLQSLKGYDCELLTTYTVDDLLFSRVYEFLGYLHNGVWEQIPVTAMPAYQVIESSYLHHSYRLIETRFPNGGNRFTSLYDLKDFPEPTKRGRFNGMLKLEFPFLLVFSLTFLASGEALGVIGQAINKMESAGDKGVEQLKDLESARGAITTGEIYFGEFHCALLVHGKSKKEAEDRGGVARTLMSAVCGATMLPANLSAPETFFSIFPGNTKRRPRPMPKTTRNLTGVFSMNTYSSGKQHGNPIGDGQAIIPLVTESNGVYHFNFHYTTPDVDTVGDKVPGHTLILGASGTGKTTAQSVIISFMERYKPKLFGIDKDGSMRGMVKALGGVYYTIEAGMPTGFNPCQLPDDEFNRNFLFGLIESCVRRPGDSLTAEDNKDIKTAIDNVYRLPFELRRFGVLLQSIPDRGENCLARRLADWCYGETAGRFAWVLDNPRNLFDWDTFGRIGFDVTEFLKPDSPVAEQILGVLFHFKELMQRRRGLLVTVVEEFWLPLMYPTPERQILDTLKTGRRRDEFVVLVSQSPSDAIKTRLLPDILEQTATKIYLANPEAKYKTDDGTGYSRLNMSPEEFSQLMKLGKFDYKFLVRQGSQSSVVKLDMSAALDYIHVLAMAAGEFPILDAAISAAGDHPDAWVPQYIQLRKEARARGEI